MPYEFEILLAILIKRNEEVRKCENEVSDCVKVTEF
jgi:hypothetical protein